MTETVVCALEGCVEFFERRVHNQRFHSRECCRVYTNARILAAYHEKKNKVTTGRVCRSKDCGTLLSRYNDDEFCALCQNKQQIKKIEDWGWEVDDEGYRIE